jgi:hypothetical protein
VPRYLSQVKCLGSRINIYKLSIPSFKVYIPFFLTVILFLSAFLLSLAYSVRFSIFIIGYIWEASVDVAALTVEYSQRYCKRTFTSKGEKRVKSKLCI